MFRIEAIFFPKGVNKYKSGFSEKYSELIVQWYINMWSTENQRLLNIHNLQFHPRINESSNLEIRIILNIYYLPIARDEFKEELSYILEQIIDPDDDGNYWINLENEYVGVIGTCSVPLKVNDVKYNDYIDNL